MKRNSLVFAGPRIVEVLEEPLPQPAQDQVLIETVVSAISAGTEGLIYRGEAPAEMEADPTLEGMTGDLQYPLRYGYACVGKVIQLGAGVEQVWEGREVFAFHPHTSHFCAGTSTLIPIPQELSMEDAVFLPNMETAVNLLHDAAPLVGERVLVFGQGIVGLLTTSLLSRVQLSKLITLDPLRERRERSLELEVDASLDPEQEEALDAIERFLEVEGVNGGADLIFELSGNPQALNLALRVAGYNSRIVVGSWYGTKEVRLELGGEFHRKRIDLVSSQVSTIHPKLRGRWNKDRRLKLALRLLTEIIPSRWITHRFDINNASQAYEHLQDPGALQILFSYQEYSQQKVDPKLEAHRADS